MTERAEAMGIPKRDLLIALALIRDFRARCLNNRLDPRAARLALLYAKHVDDYFSRQQPQMSEILQLNRIALALYQEVMREMR